MTVFVEVLLDRTTPNIFDAFKAAVLTHPEIAECHMVARLDYLIKLRVRDMEAYRRFTVGSCGNSLACARRGLTPD